MAGNSDTRDSFSDFSEEFAQSQGTAELWDPSDESFAREAGAARRRYDRAAQELQALNDYTDEVVRDEIMREYEEAADRWTLFENEIQKEGLRRPGYISLAQALRVDIDTGQNFGESDIQERLDAFRAFLAYISQEGRASLGEQFKNYCAIVRKVRPDLLGNMSQTDLSKLLGETKAAVSAREIRVVEGLARHAGVQGFQFLGGSKSPETRRRSAQAAKGNTNRRTGAQRKRG